MQLVTPPETVELGDEKVRLRPWRKEDMPALLDAVQSSLLSIGRWQAWCHAGYGQLEAEAWLTHCREGWKRGVEFAFAVLDVATGELVGAVGLNQINSQHLSANLGYWIRQSRQGHGLAARAATLAARFGFDQLQLIRIEIVTLQENHASRRTAENIGAIFESVARHRLWSWDKPHDAAVYGLIPSDLESVG